MRPMLATPGRAVPGGSRWRHEVKWDGMRVLAHVAAGEVRLTSRNENDVTVSYPELRGLGRAWGARGSLLLDGEVVALDGGRPVFGALADRMHVSSAARAERLAAVRPVTFLVFDLLALDDLDLLALPWQDRRDALEQLGLAGEHWQVPPTYDDGEALLRATREQGLEGVVSKRRDSPYRPGERSPFWVKLPHRASTTYVVGGWRPQTGSRDRLGALLVGERDGAGLRYRGRVGSGVTGRAAQQLVDALAPHVVPRPPFDDEVPMADADGATWVRPQVRVDVASLGLTPQGRLRQPSFRRLRRDLDPGHDA